MNCIVIRASRQPVYLPGETLQGRVTSTCNIADCTWQNLLLVHFNVSGCL